VPRKVLQEQLGNAPATKRRAAAAKPTRREIASLRSQ